jgi:hypothetical protein
MNFCWHIIKTSLLDMSNFIQSLGSRAYNIIENPTWQEAAAAATSLTTTGSTTTSPSARSAPPRVPMWTPADSGKLGGSTRGTGRSGSSSSSSSAPPRISTWDGHRRHGAETSVSPEVRPPPKKRPASDGV